MKLLTLVASVVFAVSAPVSAADKHSPHDDHAPLHGGIVVEAANTDFELVAQPSVITLYVRDHGKPIATQGSAGKVTLLSGTEKTEAVLTPAGENKLEAKGNFKVTAGTKVVATVTENKLEAKGNFKVTAGTKVVATVTLPGKKPINVRFAIK